jgi:general secretion pathway protein F
MPRYHYRAIEADGTIRDGHEEAENPEALGQLLASQGLRLLSVTEDADAEAGVDLDFDGRPLTDRETRDLVHEITTLSEAGLPLGNGLRALSEDMPSGRLSRLLRQIADRTDAGVSLDAALTEAQDRFPRHLRALILAGTKSGRTAQVLGDFVNYAQVGANLRRSLWLNLAYPAVLVLLFLGLTVFISTAIVQGFEAIFVDFGISLPQMTRVLLIVSRAVSEWGFALLLGPLGLIALGVLISRWILDAPARRRLFCKIPLFGPLWRWTSLAEFSHYLGLLVDSAVPLPEAVTIAAEGAHDAEMAHAGPFIAKRIQEGASLGIAAAESGVLPSGFTDVLNWAESHRSLPESLHMAGDIFEAQAQSRSRFIGSVVTVLTVVLVLWGCGFLVVALFLPLLQLITSLAG